MILRTLCLLNILAALSACDPMWVKESRIEVAPGSFPQCVVGALANAGHHTPMMRSDSDGRPRIVTFVLSGALNVTEIPSHTVNTELLQLRLIGRGFSPPEEHRTGDRQSHGEP